jgi:hypothetical protein
VGKRRSSTFYIEEREKYKALFAKVKTHHMHPHERGGDDSEFNLYPWTERSHVAWHALFANLTLREVWPLLPVAWEFLWGSAARTLSMLKCPFGRDIKRWQDEWRRAFGGPALDDAEDVHYAMMLAMAFGHRAFTSDMQDNTVLRELIADIPKGDRSWAFETCFGTDLGADPYDTLKQRIARILESTKSTRPKMKPAKQPVPSI